MNIQLNQDQESFDNFVGFNERALDIANKLNKVVKSIYIIPIKALAAILAILLIAVLLIPGYIFVFYWLKKFNKHLSNYNSVIPYISLSELEKMKRTLEKTKLQNHFEFISKEFKEVSILTPMAAILKSNSNELNQMVIGIDKQIEFDINLFNEALQNSEP